MLLRDSKFKGDASYAAVLETASATRGADKHGLRGEFLEMVKAAQRLSGEKIGAVPAVWRPSSVAIAQPRIVGSGRLVFGIGVAAGVFLAGTVAAVFVVVAFVVRTLADWNVCPTAAGTGFGPGYGKPKA